MRLTGRAAFATRGVSGAGSARGFDALCAPVMIARRREAAAAPLVVATAKLSRTCDNTAGRCV